MDTTTPPVAGPTIDEWRALYEAAGRVKALGPWEWMDEIDVFGVQDPETGELGFISVMGALGQHYSVALYLGTEGLYGFRVLTEMGDALPAEAVLSVPQLQASFEDRQTLHSADREVIKQLGAKFRGRQAWPLFRSYRPGFMPWYLEGPEARFLTHALSQTLDVAPRIRDNPTLLPDQDERYLVRVPRREDGTLMWEDRVMEVAPPEPRAIEIIVDRRLLEDLKQRPKTRLTIEVDLFVMLDGVGERGERPFFPHILLAVEAQNGFVLASEVLRPDAALEDTWGRVPNLLVETFHRLGIVPTDLKVRSDQLRQILLSTLAGALGIKVRQSNTLPSLDGVRREMLDMFGRRPV